MPFALIVATLRLILHHLDFLIQSGENNGALDLRALDEWRADGRVEPLSTRSTSPKTTVSPFFKSRGASQ